jgi:hypothetical protein
MACKYIVSVGEVQTVSRRVITQRCHWILLRLKESICNRVRVLLPVAAYFVVFGKLVIILKVGAMEFVRFQRVFVLIHCRP